MKLSNNFNFVLLQQNPHHNMAGNIRNRISVQIRLWTWNIGTLIENGLKIYDELWKRNVDLCCLQEVRWREYLASLIGLQGRRHEL